MSTWTLTKLVDKDGATKMRGIANGLMDIDDQRISDKWGPAGCVDLGSNRWLFFGWASE